MLLRKKIRLQYNSDVETVLNNLKEQYKNCIVKASIKPIEIIDNITTDCYMYFDIIY